MSFLKGSGTYKSPIGDDYGHEQQRCDECALYFFPKHGYESHCFYCYLESKGQKAKRPDAVQKQYLESVGVHSGRYSFDSSADIALELTELKSSYEKLKRAYGQLSLEYTRVKLDLTAETLNRSSTPTEFHRYIPRLLQLCHPDKHGNSAASNEITSWLLKQREVA